MTDDALWPHHLSADSAAGVWPRAGPESAGQGHGAAAGLDRREPAAETAARGVLLRQPPGAGGQRRQVRALSRQSSGLFQRYYPDKTVELIRTKGI